MSSWGQAVPPVATKAKRNSDIPEAAVAAAGREAAAEAASAAEDEPEAATADGAEAAAGEWAARRLDGRLDVTATEVVAAKSTGAGDVAAAAAAEGEAVAGAVEEDGPAAAAGEWAARR